MVYRNRLRSVPEGVAGCRILLKTPVSVIIYSMETRLLDNNKRKKIYSSKRKGQDFVVTEMFKDEHKSPKRYVCRGRKDYYKLFRALVALTDEECDKDIAYCMRHKGLAYFEYMGRYFEVRDVGYAEFYYMANGAKSHRSNNKIGISKLKELERDDEEARLYICVTKREYPLSYAFLKEKLYDKYPSPDEIGRRYRSMLCSTLEKFIADTYKQYIDEGVFGYEMKNRVDATGVLSSKGDSDV